MQRLFDHPRSTIAWAKKHIADFERESGDYLKSGAYIEVSEEDPDRAEKIHKIILVKPTPADLGHRAEDIIINLRKSLDQLANATAVASGRTGKRKAGFPFGDDFAEADSRRSGNSCDIPNAIFAVMMAFKPYKGGNSTLWALNKLAGFNKHEVVIPLIASLGKMSFNFSGAGWRVPDNWPHWDVKRNEVILAISPIDSDFQMHYDITKHIIIEKIPRVEGQEAIRFFNHLVDMMEEIVTAVEAESRRTGIL